jgi:hypothetical protein
LLCSGIFGPDIHKGFWSTEKELGACTFGAVSRNEAWYIFDNGLRHYWSRDDMSHRWVDFPSEFDFPVVSRPLPADLSQLLERSLHPFPTASPFVPNTPSVPPKAPTPSVQPTSPATQPVDNSIKTDPSPSPAASSQPSSTPAVVPTYSETAGVNGAKHTWSNYLNAGGQEGPVVAAGQTIMIACKLSGFKVADGNTWWYRIASQPWSSQYYVSADAFYNNGNTTGSLKGTPFMDPQVPNC